RAQRRGEGARKRAAHDVLEHRGGGKQGRGLKGSDEPERDDGAGLPARDVMASEPDRAGRRRDGAADDVEARGLACAIRSDQSHDLAFGNREGDVAQGIEAPEAPADLVDLQQGAHGRLPTRRASLAIAAPSEERPPGRNSSTATSTAP